MSYRDSNENINFDNYTNKSTQMSHRDFMLNKWYEIILKNIKKYSNEYPLLNDIDINDCAKDIEEAIYNKCVYKNSPNISFYFFCQIYILIFLIF